MKTSNVTTLPINSIEIGGTPTSVNIQDTAPFNSFFSDTSLCLECYEVFSNRFIFDNKCPNCGAYVDDSNVVVSKDGPKASKELALKISKKYKESKKHTVIKDEEIYED